MPTVQGSGLGSSLASKDTNKLSNSSKNVEIKR